MVPEPKGAYDRAPIFNGKNHGYWKDCIHVHINSINGEVWNATQSGHFQITMTGVDGVVIPKP